MKRAQSARIERIDQSSGLKTIRTAQSARFSIRVAGMAWKPDNIQYQSVNQFRWWS